MTRLLPLSLLLLCSCHPPGVDHRSQGSIDSQKAYSKTNADWRSGYGVVTNGLAEHFVAVVTNGLADHFEAVLAIPNLLPAVSTRAFVIHMPPKPVTNLGVTWEVSLSNTPSCGWTGSGGWKTNAQGVGYFSTNGLQWTTQYLSAAYLLTWIDEKNGGSWYQRTPANAPQATNQAVIPNTNRSGLLRSAWGWK